MAASIPTIEPSEITSGATAKWRKSLTNYKPSDGWELAYYFRGVGDGIDVQGDLVVAQDDESYLVTIPAYAEDTEPATERLTAGDYFWQSWVSNEGSGEEYQVDEGRVTVKANLLNTDTTATFDGRSQNEIQLAALRVALGQKAARDRQEYQFANRMKREHSFTDLVAWEKRLTQIVNSERRGENTKRGGSFFTNHHVRFTEPR